MLFSHNVKKLRLVGYKGMYIHLHHKQYDKKL